MANIETNIQQRIRLALGTRQDVRLFRNQVGQLPDPRTGRPVQFGLARGSADIVGWKTIEVTPIWSARSSPSSPPSKSKHQLAV